MVALVVRRRGTLEAVERDRPGKPQGVRVRVRYAGVGFADVMAVRGGYFLAPPRPFSPGYEFFGEIEESGQRVVGMLPHMGAYQQVIDVDPRWVVPVPEGLPDEAAAALPLNYLTASLLFDLVPTWSPGDSLVVHGAAGGVGTAVLELARTRGLRAYGAVSAGKEAVVEALGAVPLLRGPDWLRSARLAEPAGFRAGFDAFGGRTLRDTYDALGSGGTLVSYGFSPTMDGGNAPLFDGLLFHAWRWLFPQDGRKVALCRTPATIASRPDWYRSTLTRLLAQASLGQLRPLVGEIVEARQVELAHHRLATGQIRGKVLLRFARSGILAAR